jgi:hypothetical protein
VPEVADDLVIHEFSPVRCNDLAVAPNTLNSEHEHGTSFLHRGQSPSIDSLNAEDLARDHRSYVTASGTINHVGLSVLYRIVGHECRFVDLVLRRAYNIVHHAQAPLQ